MAKTKNTAIIFIAVLLIVAFFMFNRTDSTTVETQNASRAGTDNHAINWLKYSAADGDGKCTLYTTAGDHCPGTDITLAAYGPRERDMIFGMKTGSTWEIVKEQTSTTAGTTKALIKLPAVAGTYQFRAVSLDGEAYEGCITNILEVTTKTCEAE